jgi:hypothetical protein
MMELLYVNCLGPEATGTAEGLNLCAGFGALGLIWAMALDVIKA